MIDTQEYHESRFLVRRPWGLFVKAEGVLCSDGKRRNTIRIASSADTFFSVPAAVSVKGRTVSGYVTVECMSGSSVQTDDDPATIKFVAYTYGKNAELLPPRPGR